MRPLQTRWDWYEFTCDDPFDPMVGDIGQGGQAGRLAHRLGAKLVKSPGRNGYAVGWQVVREGDVLATVYGHSSRQGELHFVITSESCDEVVPIARVLFREHRVSRADSSVDFLDRDFDALDRLVVAFAYDHRLKHSLITNSDGGATRYLGASTSEVRLRVYKKTEQLRAAHPEKNPADIPEGIVRIELQVRPGKRDSKERLSRMDPDDLWGVSKWSLEFAVEVVGGITAPRTPTHFRRPSDWTRALHYLGAQYGPAVARQLGADDLATVRAGLLAALGLA